MRANRRADPSANDSGRSAWPLLLAGLIVLLFAGLPSCASTAGSGGGAGSEADEGELHGGPAAAPPAVTVEDLEEWRFTGADVERGGSIYRAACATCHGLRGNGRGRVAPAFETRPRDFTRGNYKWRSTISGLLPLDRDIYETISRGVRGTAMPSWEKQLSPRDRWRVVQFIKTFSRRFVDEGQDFDEDEIIVVPTPPEPTAKLVERGKAVYDKVECWKCHGKSGRGDGPSAAELRNEDGTPALAFDFTSGVYRSGRTGSAEEIYRAFYTGLNGTPMPSWIDAIQEEDRWPLVFYVKSLEDRSTFWNGLVGEEHSFGELFTRSKH